MKRTLLTITAALAMAGGAQTAQADDYGWYVAKAGCIPMEIVFDGIKTPQILSRYFSSYGVRRVHITNDYMAFFEDTNDYSQSLNIIRGKEKCEAWLNPYPDQS